MAGVANLAVEKGYHIVGIDKCFAPPMSEMLTHPNIELIKGYPEHIILQPSDMVIVGNQLARSMALIQDLVAKRVRLYSAPEWLMNFVLRDRQVIAVSGSHGKTTITSMIAWALSQAGYDPGYLIGGVSPQLGTTAKLGSGQYFVIEADEYDTAFFDKRPKFLHYWPTVLVISHIDFDHADIYQSLQEIVQQYKYLLRLLPKTGQVVATGVPSAITDQLEAFGLSYQLYGERAPHSPTELSGLSLSVPGEFNRQNAVAAFLVCQQIGLKPLEIVQYLNRFTGAARRQALMYQGVVRAYDDFAHHPKEIAAVCEGIKDGQRLLVVYHPATYTQRMGKMDQEVVDALAMADQVIVLLPPKHQMDWSLYEQSLMLGCDTEQALADCVQSIIQPQDVIIVMSANYLEAFWAVLLSHLQLRFGKQDCILQDEALR